MTDAIPSPVPSAIPTAIPSAAPSIEIRDLCKIFGPNPAAHVAAVRDGLSKADLGRLQGHILGLNNINIQMPGGRIHVIMGLSGSGKSTLIRHVNRLIEPTAGQTVAAAPERAPQGAGGQARGPGAGGAGGYCPRSSGAGSCLTSQSQNCWTTRRGRTDFGVSR